MNKHFAVDWSAVPVQRPALIRKDGVIEHMFHPVFPPKKNAAQVLAWLGQRR